MSCWCAILLFVCALFLVSDTVIPGKSTLDACNAVCRGITGGSVSVTTPAWEQLFRRACSAACQAIKENNCEGKGLKEKLCCVQLWRFKPAVQKVVNATLRELKGLNNPTVAFHIRGGDLSADLQRNVRS